jgi:hypothetical protein
VNPLATTEVGIATPARAPQNVAVSSGEAAAVEAAPALLPLSISLSRLMKFSVTAVQLALLLFVVHAFGIGQSAGLLEITWLIFAAFVLHAALPLKYRPPFFLGFSFAVFWILLGVYAVPLVLIGTALLGVCHLPVPFRWRIALLLSAAGILAAFRGAWIPWAGGHWAEIVVPIVGSMFMFRLIIYMYDLRHEKKPISIWRRLSYFFLPLNACFLLFPILDFQTYRRSDHAGDTLEIYQKGVLYLFRGITHILLYRVVYHHLMPAPWITGFYLDLRDVTLFVASAWLVYLNVSGIFHIIIGTLCLFGFNLPPTMFLYFLASSPNDLWRRANIYWKDFMMKVFYYPAFKFLQKRKFGLTASLVLATIGVFVVTWLLHSYQWFWIIGHFPMAGIDAAFWTIFAVLVLANSLIELKRGKQRSLTRRPKWSLGHAVLHSSKVVGMFLFMALMWSWWSTRNTQEWWWILSIGPKPARHVMILALILALALILGVLVQYLYSRGVQLPFADHVTSWRKSVVFSGVGALFLLGAARPEVQNFSVDAADFMASIQGEELNQNDRELLDRSYYSTLLEPGIEMWQQRVARSAPADSEMPLWAGDGLQPTGDGRYLELIPSTVSWDGTVRTNRWGMRDQEYSLEKPAGTFRIALLGGRMAMGGGVEEHEIFEAVLEERLNQEKANLGHDRFEILNFGVFKYTVFQNAVVAERKVLAFQPDVLLLVTHNREFELSIDFLIRAIHSGYDLPPEAEEAIRGAGIRQSMDAPQIRGRLLREPLATELQRWAFHAIAASSRHAGIVPVWVMLPEIYPTIQEPPRAEFEKIARIANDAGFLIINLGDVLSGLPSGDLVIADRGDPNPLAHRIVADRLYHELRAIGEQFGLAATHR